MFGYNSTKDAVDGNASPWEWFGPFIPTFSNFLELKYSYLWLKIEHSIKEVMQRKTKITTWKQTNKAPRSCQRSVFAGFSAKSEYLSTRSTRRWGFQNPAEGGPGFQRQPAISYRDGWDPEATPPEPTPSFFVCNSIDAWKTEKPRLWQLEPTTLPGEFCNGGRRFWNNSLF